MKVTYKVLVPALLAGFLLGGCAEKDTAAPAEETMGQEAPAATEEMSTEASEPVAAEAPTADEPGGYVPTDEERIPGETRE
jgi:hypothetical protein